MSSPIFDERNQRILDIHDVLIHPGFKYVEKFFLDRIEFEKSRIEKINEKPLTDIAKDTLNHYINRRNIYKEILWGLRESLQEYMKDPNFTDSDGADYQKVNGD